MNGACGLPLVNIKKPMPFMPVFIRMIITGNEYHIFLIIEQGVSPLHKNQKFKLFVDATTKINLSNIISLPFACPQSLLQCLLDLKELRSRDLQILTGYVSMCASYEE